MVARGLRATRWVVTGLQGPVVRATGDLDSKTIAEAEAMVVTAFGTGFSEDDWQHALGGWHVLMRREGRLVAHAAVVPRELHVAGVPFRTGYVEAVAVEAGARSRGLGSRLMAEVAAVVRREAELGALSTGATGFYERLGWERWRGPTFVRSGTTVVRTPEEDAGVMVLRFGRSAQVDVTSALSCEVRSGDCW